MKPPFYLQRLILACSTAVAAVSLSACGQIGPLYMPRIPADPDAPPGSVAPASETQNQQRMQRMPLPGSNNSSSQSPNIYTPIPGTR